MCDKLSMGMSVDIVALFFRGHHGDGGKEAPRFLFGSRAERREEIRAKFFSVPSDNIQL